MILTCMLIGGCVQYFTGFNWVTATLLLIIAVLVNGLIIFNEDLDEGGFDHQAGITDTPKAKAGQRKANKIQVTIILVLIIFAAWPYI